jgi:hypothetical protein
MGSLPYPRLSRCMYHQKEQHMPANYAGAEKKDGSADNRRSSQTEMALWDGLKIVAKRVHILDDQFQSVASIRKP